jgi:hypothetical protein
MSALFIHVLLNKSTSNNYSQLFESQLTPNPDLNIDINHNFYLNPNFLELS